MTTTATYCRLGDFVRPVDVRNRDMRVTQLMGISINKEFMTSVANTIGTDMSNYKIVSKKQFACNLMHVGRDAKIPIALNVGEDILVSPAYFTFEVSNDNLLSEYLNLVFHRPEFDRNAWFHTDGDVRGGMDKKGLLDLTIPVPPVEEQRRIVGRHEAIARRMAHNRQTIAALESAAQTLYRHTFVDNIDPNNLPDGWRMGTLGEICEIKGGKRLPVGKQLTDIDTGHPYIKVADIDTDKFLIRKRSIQFVDIETQKSISRYTVNSGDLIISIVGTIGATAIIDESLNDANLTENCVKFINLKGDISTDYLYHFFSTEKGRRAIETGVVGGVQGKLPIYNIQSMDIVIPNNDALIDFNGKVNCLNNQIKLKLKENIALTELQALLLTQM